MTENSKRKVNYFYKVHEDDFVSFADAMPFLIIGENSLGNLNDKLDKKIPMNRFVRILLFQAASRLLKTIGSESKSAKPFFTR
jgi:uncharacterized protein YcbX